MGLFFLGFDISIEFLVSIIGIIISSGIAIYIYFKSKKYKEISYKVSIDSLISINSQVKSKLKILYENIPIEDLYLFKITYESTGNQDIEKEDFVEPFLLEFNKEANIVNVEETECKPVIGSIISLIHRYSIEIFPNLFKVGDFFTLKLLITNYLSYTVSDRVKNTKVKKYSINKRSSQFFKLSLIILSLSIGITLISLFDTANIKLYYSIMSPMVIIALIVMLIPTIWDKEYRDKLFTKKSP